MSGEEEVHPFFEVATLHPSSVEKAAQIIEDDPEALTPIRKLIQLGVRNMGNKPSPRGYCPECGRSIAYSPSKKFSVGRHNIGGKRCFAYINRLPAVSSPKLARDYQAGEEVAAVNGVLISKRTTHPVVESELVFTPTSSSAPQEPQTAAERYPDPFVRSTKQEATYVAPEPQPEPAQARPDPAKTYSSKDLEDWVLAVREDDEVKLIAANKENDRLKKQIDQITAKDDEQITGLKASVEKYVNENNQLDERNKHLSSELDKAQVDAMSAGVLQDRVRELEDRITQSSTPEAREIQERNETLTNAIVELKGKHKEAFNVLGGKYGREVRRVKELTAKLEELQSVVNVPDDAKVEDLNATIKKLQDLNAEMMRTVETRDDTILKLRDVIEDRRNDIVRLRNTVGERDKRIHNLENALKVKVSPSVEELDQLKALLAERDQEIIRIGEDRDDLIRTHEASKAHSRDLMRQLESRHPEITTLQSELENAYEKLREATDEVDRRSAWVNPSQANALVQAERDRIRKIIG